MSKGIGCNFGNSAVLKRDKGKCKTNFLKEVNMPYGDKTGLAGQEPMTGRSAGYCAGSNLPGCGSSSPGKGMAWGKNAGHGKGRCFGKNVAIPVTPVNKPETIPVEAEPVTPENHDDIPGGAE
jgi:hypothetical protein